ncbi:MAG: 4-(cytidine 5'-diphospho)-2-C-methyl-D-erythritol kinase [Flavobacteriales bacterium]|nr:4-(cytidine 5'-diphospho)-2-C-methyl-D-erythritol kinase [Flavobacteriales bacterium]
MVFFPNAKINLGLNIIEKRPDGYHNIESVFMPIPIHDALEIIENSTETKFSSSGISIPDNGEPNLVERAWLLLKEEFNIPTVDLDLLKKIPIGAGLGGGSADAASCILGLNNIFNLNITEEKLLKIASKLGADCAFFIKNKPVFAQGIGDQFTPIGLNLKGKHFVIIYPNIHVSTPEAYKYVKPRNLGKSIKEILKQPIESWKGVLKNDFEHSVFQQYPFIKEVKNELYSNGAIYASLSGSGSTVFGIFDKKPEIKFSKEVQRWDFNL